MRFALTFLHRQRLASVEANEGTWASDTIAHAFDLFLLAPASVRAQVAELQDLPPERRRQVYSEVYDALARGSAIVRGGKRMQ